MNSSVKERFSPLIESRAFGLTALGCALISALLWAFVPGVGAWPLVIGLIPWAGRVLGGRLPIRRTPLDIPIALFMVTAGVAVWSSYNPEAAWAKFWMLVGAVLVFYAIIHQPIENIWPVIGILSAVTAAINAYYLAYKIWFGWAPAELEPDTVGGILLILFPLLAAWWMYRWTSQKAARPTNQARQSLAQKLIEAGQVIRQDWAGLGLGLALAAFMAVGLAVTKEQGIWIGMALAVAFSGVMIRYGPPDRLWRKREVRIALAVMLIIGIAALASALSFPQVIAWLKANERLRTMWYTLQLSGDYALMGGGLSAFPGLYSRYMLGIPYLFFNHGNNLFLDLALEQGWLGLAALAWTLAAGLIYIFRAYRDHVDFYPGQTALLAGLVGSFFLVVFHNLSEDALYSGQGAIWLLALPALSLCAVRYRRFAPPALPFAEKRQSLIAGGIAAIVLLGLLIITWPSLTAIYYSNLGAVQMAKAQLAGWPDQLVDGENLLSKIGPAEASFQKSLEYGSEAAATYRLGLIANERRDFAAALQYFTQANHENPSYRGIAKSLAYACAWNGYEDDAAARLTQFSEAREELYAYQYWWKLQGELELSQIAADLAARLSR